MTQGKPLLLALMVFAHAVVLGACSSDPELKTLPTDAVVLAFGDSLTAGYGVTPDVAYPAVLESLTGRTVVNAGVSGELTQEGLERLPGLLEMHSPALVIILEGGNDILRNQSLSAAKANLARMIKITQDQGADVVLVGVPTKTLFAKTAAFYAELAEEHQVPLENDIIGSLIKRREMKYDSVHFNAAGYQALAEAIHVLMQESGAL